jgi:hypothetical protein
MMHEHLEMVKLDQLTVEDLTYLAERERALGDLAHAAELEALKELIAETPDARTLAEVVARRGDAAAQARGRQLRDAVFARLGLPATDGPALNVGALKTKLRTHAAAAPRPVLLRELVRSVVSELSPAEVTLVVLDTVESWLFANTEPVRATPDGLLLVGPAAAANDPAAWDDLDD